MVRRHWWYMYHFNLPYKYIFVYIPIIRMRRWERKIEFVIPATILIWMSYASIAFTPVLQLVQRIGAHIGCSDTWPRRLRIESPVSRACHTGRSVTRQQRVSDCRWFVSAIAWATLVERTSERRSLFIHNVRDSAKIPFRLLSHWEWANEFVCVWRTDAVLCMVADCKGLLLSTSFGVMRPISYVHNPKIIMSTGPTNVDSVVIKNNNHLISSCLLNIKYIYTCHDQTASRQRTTRHQIKLIKCLAHWLNWAQNDAEQTSMRSLHHSRSSTHARTATAYLQNHNGICSDTTSEVK